MKKIYAILLAMVMIATLFIGCSKEESEAVNATTEITTTVETVDEIVDNLTEDVSVEDKTTDEEGNEVVVGKDADGNTVEIKTNSDGTITKTVTDKETGKKTEQTTAVSTTVKQTTTKSSGPQTTVKSTQTTTKKTETTIRKPNTTQQSTTKPTTTSHKHNYNTPVYKTERVKVKDAWNEPVYEQVRTAYCSACYMEISQYADKYNMSLSKAETQHRRPDMFNYNTQVPACQVATDGNLSFCFGYELGLPNYREVQVDTIHHDAEYEDKKVVDYYKCSCGATKKA